MKIVISTDHGEVSSHFGRCPEFTIVQIEGKRLEHEEKIKNPGHHPGFLPKFLHGQGVSVIVAGGMGSRAQELFAEKKIKTILGISGRVEEVIESLLAGTLEEGNSLCVPGGGKGYGIDKTECDHEEVRE